MLSKVCFHKFLLATVFLCFLMPAHAARQNEKREFYDRWSNTPSEELASHAANLIINNGNMDSAYIYLNVVYNRYVEDPNDKEKQILASRALNNMGYLMFESTLKSPLSSWYGKIMPYYYM